MLEYPNINLMVLSSLLQQMSLDHGACQVIVDGIGIGAGVVSRLSEFKINVTSFIAGARSNDPRRFLNQRAECFHTLKRLFEEQRISIPKDESLIEQLSNLEFTFNEKGVLKLVSKDDIKKSLVHHLIMQMPCQWHFLVISKEID